MQRPSPPTGRAIRACHRRKCRNQRSAAGPPSGDDGKQPSGGGARKTGRKAAKYAPGSGTRRSRASAAATAPPVTAYFVMVDDGGRHGIRFGCNDSLVASAPLAGAGDGRLKAAIAALLDGGQQADGLYNALGGSRLKFLSGSFDGTTVTVYLAGALKPGGTCDLPRIDAQLTQTALEAVGAVRADIYINGKTLADSLKLK
ncbi:GerMN domain-containing protein [Arthrobacter sp. FX8]|uniref:GerMN domain-containing protein n=1 Tax=Arthrobacter sp. FX8 TaxID=2997335 RepID=UPI00227C8FED|nr:GerMN domain-containing protein [Arthrobacter sp. FX8]WAJ32718.1 GerMN domain-containing protein [Arthrobacter sp. FX8]